MSARGRGRGRGRGSQMSFDYSQLGFSGGDALPAPVLQPPPTFPPLEHKPVPLKSGPESEYMVALKRDFVEFLQTIRPNNDSSSMIERFSDKYQVISSDIKENWESQICWELLPAELNPKARKSKRKSEINDAGVHTKKPHIDITKKLDELAKLEDKEDEESEEAKEPEEKEDDENRENLEEEDEDEEMDDGTDYVNNYFDNGESYFDDEDDNLDDGPIY